MARPVACVVPARLGSTRFFGKLLEPLLGKPVVIHTLERAAGAGCFDRVLCLTDSPEIGEAAAAHGFDWLLTGEAANGTERIARSLDAAALRGVDLFVNLQGDEPAFPEEGLRALCAAIRREPERVHLLVHAEAPSPEDLANVNRVKVVMDAEDTVTGFARDIGAPGGSESARRGAACCAPTIAGGMKYRRQWGAYAYARGYLARYAALPPSALEIELSHEMLRAPGLAPLRAHPLALRAGASVDVPADLIAARRALEERTAQNNERQPSLQGAPA